MQSTADAGSTIIDNTLELEERRARLVKLQNENAYQEEITKAYKLDVLDKYKVYAMKNITDPRIKEQIQNEITNRKCPICPFCILYKRVRLLIIFQH